MNSDKLSALQDLRLKVHRLEPSQPLRTARNAARFVKGCQIVMATGRSSLPMLAEAIVGRHLVGSWMAHPEAHRIYRILRTITQLGIVAVPIILGKEVLIDVALGPSAERIASDAERREMARKILPKLARELLDRIEAEGHVRMDRWGIPTSRARPARLVLQRELLVSSREVHTERGYHTSLVTRWDESEFSKRFAKKAADLTYEEAADRLLLAAVRSAVVASEREVRRWFPFGATRVDALCETGELHRLTADGTKWLVHSLWV